MRAILIIPALTLALFGCAEPTATSNSGLRKPIPQYDPRNPMPWCMAAAELAQDPFIGPVERRMVLTRMEQSGCF